MQRLNKCVLRIGILVVLWIDLANEFKRVKNMFDKTYKLLVENDYMKVYFSKEYAQFAIVDEISDTEDIYTLEEFELLQKAFNSIK